MWASSSGNSSGYRPRRTSLRTSRSAAPWVLRREFHRTACEMSGWARPNFLDTLAAAYAAAGDFDRAVEYQQKALSFPDFEKEDGKGGRDRLRLYMQRKPLR